MPAQTAKRKPRKAKRVQTNEPIAKRTVGRPTDYRPEYCETVIELGRKGKSRHQIAAHLDIAVNTLALWEGKHILFMQSMLRANQLAQAWFEDKAQNGMETREFNANLWKLQTYNRFRDSYSDRQAVDVNHSGQVGMESADNRQVARAVLALLGSGAIGELDPNIIDITPEETEE